MDALSDIAVGVQYFGPLSPDQDGSLDTVELSCYGPEADGSCLTVDDRLGRCGTDATGFGRVWLLTLRATTNHCG